MASTFLRHLLFYISACYCAVLVLIHHHLHSKPVHVGVQKEPLGSVHDYATRAYSAAQAASSGRVAGDAYEKAAAKAAEEAAAASGARASRSIGMKGSCLDWCWHERLLPWLVLAWKAPALTGVGMEGSCLDWCWGFNSLLTGTLKIPSTSMREGSTRLRRSWMRGP
eukprot:1142293-Pelagomonas_calceolata.AAC.4